jgi:hypothetical protein
MSLSPLFITKTTKTAFRSICLTLVFATSLAFLTEECLAQSTSDPSQYDVSYDARKSATIGHAKATAGSADLDDRSSHAQVSTHGARAGCPDAFIPRDGSYASVPRNDDGSLGPILLPFGFSFCGSTYTNVWINTNGNLTFTGPLATFTPDGFPINIPMVAPFWADVDTRTCNGQAYYKVFADHMIVTWDQVGYYNLHCEKTNTFQVIISDGNALLPGGGNNVQFRYGDMQWTTGDASGGSNGFGGSPATVGFNAGDALNYEQAGRFDHAGADFDGPFGNPDGVSYLDGNCFSFDSAEDLDGDGITACFDCNDNNPDIYPGQVESCNGEDDNCNGDIDEGFDTDGDGYTSCGGDCDDSNADIHPDAEEICDDADNNCDGLVDEGFTNTDGDDQADCVDADDDNDGCLDEDDTNPLETSGDADCDGVHDDCDICPSGDDTVDNNDDGIADCSQLLNYEEYSEAWYCANNKIAICHNGNTLCVSKSSIPAHYAHGDNMGPCTSCDENRNVSTYPVGLSFEGTELELFPNPASDQLNIHFEPVPSKAVLRITDQLNRVVWIVKLNPGQTMEKLDLTSVPVSNGMYFVVIEMDGKQLTKRFVLLR